MKIEILGMGCPRCKMLYDNTLAALENANINAEVVKVEDLITIANYAVLMTPALVVDGEVKSSGDVLSPEEIQKLF